MKKEFQKQSQNNKKGYKYNRPKTVNRFWGLATRMEHRNVGGKKSK